MLETQQKSTGPQYTATLALVALAAIFSPVVDAIGESAFVRVK